MLTRILTRVSTRVWIRALGRDKRGASILACSCFTSHAHTRMDTNRVHVAVVFSLVLKCGDQYDTFLHKKPAPTSSTQGADHQSHIRTIDIPCRFGFSPGSSRRRIWVAGETFSVRQFPGVLAETAKYTVLDRRIRDAEFGRGGR